MTDDDMIPHPQDPDVLDLAKRVKSRKGSDIAAVRAELEALDHATLTRVTLAALFRLEGVL
jgi:hypothetical protein